MFLRLPRAFRRAAHLPRTLSLLRSSSPRSIPIPAPTCLTPTAPLLHYRPATSGQPVTSQQPPDLAGSSTSLLPCLLRPSRWRHHLLFLSGAALAALPMTGRASRLPYLTLLLSSPSSRSYFSPGNTAMQPKPSHRRPGPHHHHQIYPTIASPDQRHL